MNFSIEKKRKEKREKEEKLEKNWKKTGKKKIFDGAGASRERERGRESGGGGERMDVEEAREERRKQAELRAAAAERRMMMQQKPTTTTTTTTTTTPSTSPAECVIRSTSGELHYNLSSEWKSLDDSEMSELFCCLFGSTCSNLVLSQWTSQGLQVGEESILAQQQGGPCGVLAPVQAFMTKHLVFNSKFGGDLSAVSLEESRRALKAGLCEALWRAGNYERGCLFVLKPPASETVGKVKESISLLESACSLDDILGCFKDMLFCKTFKARTALRGELDNAIEVFQTDLGVLLVLLSIIASRGLEEVQEDRDDTSQPLISQPFGHASQEIVNLFLCGKGVTNVFDGDMDMGDDYKLKGIASKTQVGFLSLLESSSSGSLIQVGYHLKEPEYPVWVLGSESHYTVLFSVDRSVQDEDSKGKREREIRKVFDEYDKSGGGGFVSIQDLPQVLTKARCAESLFSDFSSDIVTWYDLWSRVQTSESLQSASGKTFQMYHVNQIVKCKCTREHTPSIIPNTFLPFFNFLFCDV